MGRDARVYRKREHLELPAKLLAHVELVDPATGQLDFEEGWENPAFDKLIAVDERIGNLAAVAYLRTECQRLIPDSSALLAGKVLWNGVACGDHLPPVQVPGLRAELEALERRAAEAESPERVRSFIVAMRRLCDAAEREGNAICF